MPALCDTGCSKCSNENPSQCITCMNGFALQTGNTCAPCQSPCKTCSSTNNTMCLSCYNGAYLSNNLCLQCNSTSNCLTCSSSNLTQCLTCPFGSTLNTTSNTCNLNCPNNCLSCSNSNTCTLCIEGYSPNAQGVCLPCLSNCRGCSSQANAICINCGQGFYLNTQQVCAACSSFCLTCSSLGCSVCASGYTLTSAFTCAQTCQAPCATCSITNNAQCTSCLAGYTYSQSTASCTPVTNCSGPCTVCPFNFVLSNQQCLQCGNTKCARCLATNLNVCSTCYSGSYLNQGVCNSCPTGCSTCSTPTNCLSCGSGYTSQVQTITTQTLCVACQAPCAQCIGNAQTCTVCQQGYTLNGWKCVSTFNFGFSIVLNVNLTTFYSNYASFLSSIGQSVQSSNVNVITMNALNTGSVIANGNVTTTTASDSNQATNQYTSLQTTLSSGNSIGGMPITSSSLAVNGGEIIQPSSGPNLALILGISIPLGLLCNHIII